MMAIKGLWKKILKDSYVKRAISILVIYLLIEVAFLAYNLDIFHSFCDLLKWLFILLIFTLLVILVSHFLHIKSKEILQDIWIGLGLNIITRVTTIQNNGNILDIALAGSFYLVIGIVIWIIGYYRTKNIK